MSGDPLALALSATEAYFRHSVTYGRRECPNRAVSHILRHAISNVRESPARAQWPRAQCNFRTDGRGLARAPPNYPFLRPRVPLATPAIPYPPSPPIIRISASVFPSIPAFLYFPPVLIGKDEADERRYFRRAACEVGRGIYCCTVVDVGCRVQGSFAGKFYCIIWKVILFCFLCGWSVKLGWKGRIRSFVGKKWNDLTNLIFIFLSLLWVTIVIYSHIITKIGPEIKTNDITSVTSLRKDYKWYCMVRYFSFFVFQKTWSEYNIIIV